MRLWMTRTSPFARKVRVVAVELGLHDQIEEVDSDVWSPNSEITSVNPLAKIPTLETDDGAVIFDSPVICEFLDGLTGGSGLFPPPGEERWLALGLQALADGMCDAAIARRLDSSRPAEQQSSKWQKRQRAAMFRSWDMLNAEADLLGIEPTIGTTSVAVALAYMDFRWSAENWRRNRPGLDRWFEKYRTRRSIQQTEFA